MRNLEQNFVRKSKKAVESWQAKRVGGGKFIYWSVRDKTHTRWHCK